MYRTCCSLRAPPPLPISRLKASRRTSTSSARLVLTDSGGLQKEAYWLSVPCVTLRDETEWVETTQAGWNTLAGSDSERIVHAVRSFSAPERHPALYGDGDAAARCVDLL